MSANKNWARWIFHSVASQLKEVATDANLPVLIEHFDERTASFERATDKAEIRITGPFDQELSKGYHRIYVDVNVLLTSRYDGASKNAATILKNAGLFHEAMSEPIPVYNFGGEPGDYVEADSSSQVFLGCLTPRPGRNDSVRVMNFGQLDNVDKIKQTEVDARFVMELIEP
jgi:hypothetical protein